MIGIAALTESDITSSPLVVYFSVAFGIIVLAMGKMPTVAKAWTDFLAERRRTAVDKDDADIAELRRQVTNLQDWRREKDQMDRKHMEWDREMYAKALDAGWDVEPPPSLF